jgi:hypothetical protein
MIVGVFFYNIFTEGATMTGRMWGAFLTGVTIGVGITLALTSEKAEEIRNEFQDQAEDRINQWRRKGRRSIAHVQDIVEKSGDTISRVVDTTQSALDAISSKL